MKKFVAFLSLFSLLTAFTCENEPLDSDIDNSVSDNSELLGDWSLVEFTVDLSTSTDFNGQTIGSDIDVQSTSADYTLTLAGNTFTTNGSYSYNANVVVNGEQYPSDPYTLEDVSGDGNYSTNGNEITVDGQFFEFTFEGNVDTSAFDGEQTATYALTDNGQTLTISQNESTSDTDSSTGAQTSTNTVSTSVWTRL